MLNLLANIFWHRASTEEQTITVSESFPDVGPVPPEEEEVEEVETGEIEEEEEVEEVETGEEEEIEEEEVEEVETGEDEEIDEEDEIEEEVADETRRVLMAIDRLNIVISNLDSFFQGGTLKDSATPNGTRYKNNGVEFVITRETPELSAKIKIVGDRIALKVTHTFSQN